MTRRAPRAAAPPAPDDRSEVKRPVRAAAGVAFGGDRFERCPRIGGGVAPPVAPAVGQMRVSGLIPVARRAGRSRPCHFNTVYRGTFAGDHTHHAVERRISTDTSTQKVAGICFGGQVCSRTRRRRADQRTGQSLSSGGPVGQRLLVLRRSSRPQGLGDAVDQLRRRSDRQADECSGGHPSPPVVLQR